MNSLSWIIYAADVVRSTNIILILLMVLIPVIVIFKMLHAEYNDGLVRLNKPTQEKENFPFTVKQMITAWCVIAVVSVAIPSRQTVILIASSEYGEKILNNPKIGEIVDPSIDLLKTWIEKEKNELVEKETKK